MGPVLCQSPVMMMKVKVLDQPSTYYSDSHTDKF